MRKKKLIEEIREYQQGKRTTVPLLVALGMLGIVVPILPGLAFIFLAFLLVFPRQGDAFYQSTLKRFRGIFCVKSKD